MIRADQVAKLVTALRGRQARLYHACQLRDFESYLQLGGVPSRATLEASGLAMTPFESDAHDRALGVWDKVFFNLSDFGEKFAWGGSLWTPVVYGPIQIVLAPSVLNLATDICVSLHTVWPAPTGGFDREIEGLSLDDVARIYKNDSPWIRTREDLNEEFGITDANNPEVSVSIPEGIARFGANVQSIIVDPYRIGDHSLLGEVKSSVDSHGHRWRVRVRRSPQGIVDQDELKRTYEQLSAADSELAVTPEEPTPMFVDCQEKARTNTDYRNRIRLYKTYLRRGTMSRLYELAQIN